MIPVPLRPQLRPLEAIPFGQEPDLLFALRDPEGLSETVVLPRGAALLAALMDGRRTLAEIQAAFLERVGQPVSLLDVQRFVEEFHDGYLLAGERFEAFREAKIDEYLNDPVRPAVHAGGAYARDPEELRDQLAAFLAHAKGPGPINPDADANGRQLCGVLCPHIDLRRGGPVFAWAYKKIVEESDADLFVIFGTAHHPMEELFCVSRKDFDTPLGIVHTDNRFVDRLVEYLASSEAGREIDPFADELVHRPEHSIEFQAMFLQYVLGPKRPFRIVPVLTGSFQEFLDRGMRPDQSPPVQAFLAAMRAAVDEHAGGVCFISAADLAHIGQRFGDDWLLDDQRLAEQLDDDRRLLDAACRGDSAGFFQHVADQDDRNRICGLAPTYSVLKLVDPVRGELLTYDQAVEPDNTSCVSFASLAFYRR